MRKIYICAAYEGNSKENIEKIKYYCRVLAIKYNVFPVVSNLYLSQFLNETDKNEKNLISSFKLDLMKDCEQVYVFGEITKEMIDEIKLAWKNQIDVAFFKYNEKSNCFKIYSFTSEERKELFG